MASSPSASFSSKSIIISFAHIIIIIIIILIIISLAAPTKQAFAACFESIISFGDSISDTGNLAYLGPPSERPLNSDLPPYGITFFHRPTGRSSDGRLIIDFIAEDLGLPFTPPFQSGVKNVSRGGVNFAVAGATALADPFFAKNGVQLPTANVSLLAQLTWFNDIFLPSLCHKPAGCDNFLETSLVIVGEIGGNDYNHPFIGGKSVDVVRLFVPQVVEAITSAINELIKIGAVTIMVPGVFPIGCSAYFLTFFKSSSDVNDYDPETSCLNWLNELSQYHNEMLQLELDHIRLNNPNVNIIYADYYNAAMLIYRSPHKYGFAEGALRACCGGGGPYNVDLTVLCGEQGSDTCANPSSHVSWDGLHLTEAAYRWMATFLLRGSFTVPQIKSVCSKNVSVAAGDFPDH